VKVSNLTRVSVSLRFVFELPLLVCSFSRGSGAGDVAERDNIEEVLWLELVQPEPFGLRISPAESCLLWFKLGECVVCERCSADKWLWRVCAFCVAGSDSWPVRI